MSAYGTTRIVTRAEIERALPHVDAIAAMERAFAAYSAGRARVTPVGELLFERPGGEVHIKSGYIAGDGLFVVKVATGFYENPARGLAANSGLMLAFNTLTGEPKAILLDQGILTDIRTAAAGAVAAKYLAPKDFGCIGIIGSGVQARLQAEYLKEVTACRTVAVWARRPDAAEALASALRASGFDAATAATPSDIAARANLIVTTTPSHEPHLKAHDIRPGTHITAVGADSPDKNEIAMTVFAKADIVAADSMAQCAERGDLRHALRGGTIATAHVVELGNIVRGTATGRTSDDQITLADLTGVAVQDIEIAKAVLAELEGATS